jgi:hypothetical protein
MDVSQEKSQKFLFKRRLQMTAFSRWRSKLHMSKSQNCKHEIFKILKNLAGLQINTAKGLPCAIMNVIA